MAAIAAYRQSPATTTTNANTTSMTAASPGGGQQCGAGDTVVLGVHHRGHNHKPTTTSNIISRKRAKNDVGAPSLLRQRQRRSPALLMSAVSTQQESLQSSSSSTCDTLNSLQPPSYSVQHRHQDRPPPAAGLHANNHTAATHDHVAPASHTGGVSTGGRVGFGHSSPTVTVVAADCHGPEHSGVVIAPPSLQSSPGAAAVVRGTGAFHDRTQGDNLRHQQQQHPQLPHHEVYDEHEDTSSIGGHLDYEHYLNPSGSLVPTVSEGTGCANGSSYQAYAFINDDNGIIHEEEEGASLDEQFEDEEGDGEWEDIDEETVDEQEDNSEYYRLTGSDVHLSDVTPEAQLVSKFKHVYAGRGGWLGVTTSSSSVQGSPARSGHHPYNQHHQYKGTVSGSSGGAISTSSTTSGAAARARSTCGSASALLRRHRHSMPRAQYERYKKEIMHKLARSLEQSVDATGGAGDGAINSAAINQASLDAAANGNESVAVAVDEAKYPEKRNTLTLRAGVPNGVLSSAGSQMTQHGGKVTIPASWRLPVGWAGRNKGNFLSPRSRPNRKSHDGRLQKVGNHDDISHAQQQQQGMVSISQRGTTTSTVRTSQQQHQPPIQQSRISVTNTLRDRTQFTQSWVANSAFSGPRPTNRKAGGRGKIAQLASDTTNDNDAAPGSAKVGGGQKPPVYTLRIGPLALPQSDTEMESSLGPPSRVQTDVVAVNQQPDYHNGDVTGGGGMNTSRTGVTSQSFPLQSGGAARGAKKRRTKNPRQLIRNGASRKIGGGSSRDDLPPPTSSRRSMNMFSRMSLEAQAALKELGMAKDDDGDVDAGSGYSGDMRDKQPVVEDDLLEVNKENTPLPDVVVTRPTSPAPGATRSAAAAHLKSALTEPIEHDRQERVVHSNTTSQRSAKSHLSNTDPNTHSAHNTESIRNNKGKSNNENVSNRLINGQDGECTYENSESWVQGDKDAPAAMPNGVVDFERDGHVQQHPQRSQSRNKLGSSSSAADSSPKQCSCKVRAGIVFKNNIRNSTVNNSTKNQTSVTVHVRNPHHITNGCAAHSNNTSPNVAKNTTDSYVADGTGNGNSGLRVAVSHVSKAPTRLPNIRESPTGSGSNPGAGNATAHTESTTPFLGTHRQIPGVGQYRKQPLTSTKPLVIKHWGRENTFEITPVGYDSRFEDIAKEEDIDETPEEIKEKAILKCTDWLRKYHTNT